MSPLTSLGFSIRLLRSKPCRLTIALRPDVGGKSHWMDTVGTVVVRLAGTPPRLTRKSYRSLVCAMIAVLHLQACAPTPGAPPAAVVAAAALSPTLTPTPVAVVAAATLSPTLTPPPVAVAAAATPAPASTPTTVYLPTLILDRGLVWSAGFETGDLTELSDEENGDFVRQGAGSFSLVSPHAHHGRYSVALTIDTAAWSATGAHAAYLFYWNQLPENEYYYSAWYYIPSGITPHGWWNVWQWKSTYDGDSDNSWPVFTLNVGRESGDLGLRLFHKLPGREDTVYRQQLASLPIERWFHIEAFYRRATDESGQVIVWQDNQEIFNVSNVQTALADNTIHWSVNNYTDRVTPDVCTIYVDDMAISRIRLGS